MPLSLPVMTTTVSSFFMRILLTSYSTLRCQRHDLHKAFVSQFSGNRPEDTSSHWVLIFFVFDYNSCVLVEFYIASVCSSGTMLSPNNNSLNYIAFLYNPPE